MMCIILGMYSRVDSRLVSSQWETSLQSNGISHWLGANLEWALYSMDLFFNSSFNWSFICIFRNECVYAKCVWFCTELLSCLLWLLIYYLATSSWLRKCKQILILFLDEIVLDKQGFSRAPLPVLAPVPLSIFRSNSKFDENSKHSSIKYTRPITTIFCTRHDSVTVVTCAKYRCDRSSIFETRAFWIFIEFDWTKYA